MPCVGWSGSGLEVNYKKDGEIGAAAFEEACVHDAESVRPARPQA